LYIHIDITRCISHICGCGQGCP